MIQITEITPSTGFSTSHDAILFRDDYVFDERLVEAVAASEGTLLVDSEEGTLVAAHVPASLAGTAARWLADGRPPAETARAGLRLAEPATLADSYTARLRRASAPWLFRARPERVHEIEQHIFGASYKNVTDLVTRYVWPAPARLVTRALAERGVHPNWITLCSWLMVLLATWLFWIGQFGLALLPAWAMTFLDTVDGKLARVTVRSSAFGHVFDHGLDLLHPPVWYAAFALGLSATAFAAIPSLWITVVGYLVGRLIEGLFLLLFKIEIHVWTPLDSRFRTITARRNPNLILLTAGALAGRPDLGLFAVALWTLACIVFHTVRLAQAITSRREGREIVPWNTLPTADVPIPSARAAMPAAQALLAAFLVSGAALLAPSNSARAAEPDALVAAPPPDEVSLVHAHRGRGDPASRLPEGELAIEFWDFTARFESGHVLVLEFLNTNIGFGDGNVAVTGQLVAPDGQVTAFDTGDGAGDWTLSPDGTRLELQKALLDLGGREVVIRFDKKRVKLDLRLTATGPAGWPAALSRMGYAVDLLESAAPIAGTVWVEGMEAPLTVQGRAGATHRWFSDLESRLVQRRVELFSLSGDTSVYLIHALAPDGRATGWLRVERRGQVLREAELSTTAVEMPAAGAARTGYEVPRLLRVQGPGISGSVRFDQEIVRYDPLGSLPAAIRVVVSVATRPRRIWSRSSFELELSDPAGGAPLQLRGSAIGEVTYLNPLSARSVHVDVPRSRVCEGNECASAF